MISIIHLKRVTITQTYYIRVFCFVHSNRRILSIRFDVDRHGLNFFLAGGIAGRVNHIIEHRFVYVVDYAHKGS